MRGELAGDGLMRPGEDVAVLRWRIYVADDPRISERVRRFLCEKSHRGPYMSEPTIRSSPVTWLGPHDDLATDEVVGAMVRFEERFGGLSYSVLGRNKMEYGLDGDISAERTPLGPAFGGVVDGDWTWGLDVLLDGRTAMEPGRWQYRVIDRSVMQRIERHALLVEVRGWFHRTFECLTPPHVWPITDERRLPPAVPEATGPAESWWSGSGVAVQATLKGWPPERDLWTVRYFARKLQWTADANPTVYAAVGHETVPATWCSLCTETVLPGTTCSR
jgi:hypothetical protein